LDQVIAAIFHSFGFGRGRRQRAFPFSAYWRTNFSSFMLPYIFSAQKSMSFWIMTRSPIAAFYEDGIKKI
jgi:hypothetical protein